MKDFLDKPVEQIVFRDYVDECFSLNKNPLGRKIEIFFQDELRSALFRKFIGTKIGTSWLRTETGKSYIHWLES